MQQEWLRNISILWLIQGHLTQEDALKMVEVAESSIKFNRIQESDINLPRCIKLNDLTVYNFEHSNESARNPNSCINVIHAYEHDIDMDKEAAATVLVSLIAEPAFR